MKNIIVFLLSFFATLLPIISFSQMDDPLNGTIIQQIPSTNTQSQPGYIILATIIINDMEIQNCIRLYNRYKTKYTYSLISRSFSTRNQNCFYPRQLKFGLITFIELPEK